MTPIIFENMTAAGTHRDSINLNRNRSNYLDPFHKEAHSWEKNSHNIKANFIPCGPMIVSGLEKVRGRHRKLMFWLHSEWMQRQQAGSLLDDQINEALGIDNPVLPIREHRHPLWIEHHTRHGMEVHLSHPTKVFAPWICPIPEVVRPAFWSDGKVPTAGRHHHWL